MDSEVGGRLNAHVPLDGRFTQSAVQLKATRGHDISGVAFGMEDMVVESWHHGKAAADDSHGHFNDARCTRVSQTRLRRENGSNELTSNNKSA